MFVAEHTKGPFSRYFWSVVSVLTATYYIKKLLWWYLRVVLGCGYRDTDLEGSLKLCPFDKIIAVGLPLGAMSLLTMSSWPDSRYQVCFSSSGTDFKVNQRAEHYLTIFTPLWHPRAYLARYACCYCSASGSRLGKTMLTFSQQPAYHFPVLESQMARKKLPVQCWPCFPMSCGQSMWCLQQ